MSQNQATQAKKPYHTPELKKFGSVSDLTLTNDAFAPNPDGGSGFPNLYAS